LEHFLKCRVSHSNDPTLTTFAVSYHNNMLAKVYVLKSQAQHLRLPQTPKQHKENHCFIPMSA
jgi:hypothetical protein